MLAIGGSVEVTLQWDAQAISGQHSITVTADDANTVDESNESTNSLAGSTRSRAAGSRRKISVEESARKGRLFPCNKSRDSRGIQT